jgi:sugar lactone lactonase YvrE
MHPIIRILATLAFGLWCDAVRAQLPDGWSFANPLVIGTAEGLLSGTVRDVVQDEEGFIWIATSKGLHRYDGRHMQIFLHDPRDSTTLPSEDITALALNEGVLWVGTADAGLARFDRRTHRSRRFRHVSDDLRSIANERINWLMLDRGGKLFVGANLSSICLYRPDSDDFDRIPFPTHPDVYADRMRMRTYTMVQDVRDEGIYWITTSQGLLRLVDKGWRMNFLLAPESRTAFNLDKRTNNLRSMIQCPNGDLLIGTWGAGVLRYDTLRRSFTRYAIEEEGAIRQFTNTYNAVARLSDGTLILGNNTTGMAVLDTSAHRIHHLDAGRDPRMSGLAGHGIWNMSTTSAGDLLVTTREDVRLFSPHRQHFRAWPFKAMGRPYVGLNEVRAMLPLPDGSVLFGGYGLDGLYHLDPSTGGSRYIPPPAAVWNDPVREHFSIYGLLALGPDRVLVLESFLLYEVDLLSGRMVEAQSVFNDRNWNAFFHGMVRHSSGDIYILGRHDGLIRLGPGLDRLEQYLPVAGDTTSIAHGNYLYAAAEDRQGRLWVGHEKGYAVFDPATRRFINSDPAQRNDSIVALKSVFSVTCDARGRIWMADGRRGLVRVDDPTMHPFAMRSITSEHGLVNERVLGLASDLEGGVWAVGRNGLEHLLADGGNDGHGTAQGLPATTVPGVLVLLPDGRPIGGSGRNLYWERIAPVNEDAVRSSLYIASVKVFERELDPFATYRHWSELRFRHDENFFSILLSAIDPRGIHAHRLEYELHPFSGGWTDAGPDRTAVFTNVPGGDYTFRVRAVAADGAELGRLEMPLVVVPPYWQTWWFRSAVAIAILTLVYAFYRIRINAIRKEARLTTAFNKRLADVELTALRAQMNPHFLFNALNSIRHHVLNSRPDEADRYLSKFARLIRLILDHSDQRSVPLADELQALRLYLELEASRFDDKFSFHIQVDPSIDTSTTMIPPMLIQPYLENAIWHGLMQKPEGGELVLRIGHEGEHLRIEVEDDGIGRAKAAEIKSRSALKKRSMGMSITQQRLSMIEKQQGIRCHLHVEDLVLPDGEPGGTRITLLIPLT